MRWNARVDAAIIAPVGRPPMLATGEGHAGAAFPEGELGERTGTRGVQLRTRRWAGPQPSPTRVVIVHGLKDHGGRYAPLARALVAAGCGVDALDLAGHGGSEGPRADVPSFDDYLADVAAFAGSIRREADVRTVVLLGHSMGGAIAFGTIAERSLPIDGLVLTGAALAVPVEVSAARIALTRWIARLVPRARVFDLPDDRFSRDPNAVAALRADPLVYRGKATARLAAGLLRRIALNRPRFAEMELPFLAVHGGADTITNPAGSWDLAAEARSPDRRAWILEGVRHDVWHEPESPEVIRTVTEWIASRFHPSEHAA